MRPVLPAREEQQKRPALSGHVIANRSPGHGIAGLEFVEHGSLRDWAGQLELDVAVDTSQLSQMHESPTQLAVRSEHGTLSFCATGADPAQNSALKNHKRKGCAAESLNCRILKAQPLPGQLFPVFSMLSISPGRRSILSTSPM